VRRRCEVEAGGRAVADARSRAAGLGLARQPGALRECRALRRRPLAGAGTEPDRDDRGRGPRFRTRRAPWRNGPYGRGMDARNPCLRGNQATADGRASRGTLRACGRTVGPSSEAAFWLALAWTAIVVMAIVSAAWRPRHTHPMPARCECVECVVRRTR